jgi:type VI secretion system protein ImpH
MKDSISDQAYRFDFFQAIKVLERLYPDRQPIGQAGPPSREVVRIHARVSLEFPASEIQQITRAEGEDPQPNMTVNFMGLMGPLGELPRHYTELLLERANQKDFALRDFLDLFNHRMISLFYRAWEKYRFPVTCRGDTKDNFSHYLSSLIGIGTPGLQKRLAVKDEALLFYAGTFTRHTKSACALEGILSDYFGEPAHTEQFVGRWVRVGEENTTRLGIQNSELGRNMLCGERIWDRQSKFRVRLGPLRLSIFRRFLPCGDLFQECVQIVRLFAGLEYDFDLQLVLKADEVPACQLISKGGAGAQLGWSAWLKTQTFRQDAQDTIIASNV